MRNDLTVQSEISDRTIPQLHLRPGTAGTLVWYYLSDTGPIVPLDTTHTLISEYTGTLEPATIVDLHVYNDTDIAITLDVQPQGTATVDPKGPQSIPAHGNRTWRCARASGLECPCAQQLTCKCASWDVTGASSYDPTIPDPTFKVRWQARIGDPSAA